MATVLSIGLPVLGRKIEQLSFRCCIRQSGPDALLGESIRNVEQHRAALPWYQTKLADHGPVVSFVGTTGTVLKFSQKHSSN